MKKFDLKTAVIGVGSMGRHHARVYSEISNLVGVVDPNEDFGTSIAKEYGVSWFDDYKSIISEVDAVRIAVQTNLHLPVALDLMSAEVNVLIEKPLAGNVEDAQRIIESSEKNNVVLGVGHIERHNSVIRESKLKILNGDWNQPLILSARRFSTYPVRINDVGVMSDLTVHDVDIIRYLASDRVLKVFATGGKAKNKHHEDFITLQLQFENGAIGICETNWLAPIRVRKLDLTTPDQFVNINYLDQTIKVSSFTSSAEDSGAEVIRPKVEEPLKSELIDFLTSVEGKSKPLVTGPEALEAVRIVEAGLKSIKNNEVINI